MQDQSSIQLSIIVPTYNERENIPTLVSRVHQALEGYKYELIVVDDNSPDGTAQIAESLSEKYPVRVICRKTERGLATAVVTGFNQAKGEVLGVIDADLQHPPERIPELLHAIHKGADVAIGSRYIPGGGMEGWSRMRQLMSKVATLVARISLPSVRKVNDPMSGFFLLRKGVIDDVELKPVGYKILLEILARGHVKGVAEIPYVFRERERGESKLNITEQRSYLQHVIKLAANERGVRRFIQFCLVGTSGVGVNLFLLWLLHGEFGLSHHISGIISIEASVLSNFILNDTWTFRDRRRGYFAARALKFNVVSIVGAGINFALFSALTDVVELHYILSMLAGIAAATAWNFGVNFLWTWRKEEE